MANQTLYVFRKEILVLLLGGLQVPIMRRKYSQKQLLPADSQFFSNRKLIITYLP